jgi:hypothetical protein
MRTVLMCNTVLIRNTVLMRMRRTRQVPPAGRARLAWGCAIRLPPPW